MSNVTSGYLLPPGDAYTDDLRCALVWYPNKDEYRRALRGSLDYLATWVAWERDINKRGQDAARAWKLANEKTAECIEMANCLDDLIAEVRAFKNLVSGLIICCDGSIVYGPGPEPITSTIDPGVGDPPAYYGETPITTWDEWYDHVCYNAHRYVDQLVDTATDLNVAASTTAFTIGLVAAALALLSFTGIGLPIAYALAATVLSGLGAASTAIFATTAANIEASRDDIVCSFILGEDLGPAVQDALGETSLDWVTFFQFVDYGSARAIVYEGGANGEYLPDDTLDTCSCAEAEPDHVIYTFTLNSDGWSLFNRCNWVSDGGGRIRLYPLNSGNGLCRTTRDKIATDAGIVSSTLIVSAISFDYEVNDLGCSKNLRLRVTYTDDTYTQHTWTGLQGVSGNYYVTFDDTKVLKSGTGVYAVYFEGYTSTTCNTSIRIDNVKIYVLGTPV